MPNLKCNVCERVFSGEDALVDIKEHLLTCAVSEISNEDEKDLIQRLKESFPFISSIEYENQYDDDEPDYLRIIREDTTSYKVPYRYPYTYTNCEKEDPY